MLALPAGEVLPAALALARDIAENAAPVAVAVSKRLLWEEPALEDLGTLGQVKRSGSAGAMVRRPPRTSRLGECIE